MTMMTTTSLVMNRMFQKHRLFAKEMTKIRAIITTTTTTPVIRRY